MVAFGVTNYDHTLGSMLFRFEGLFGSGAVGEEVIKLMVVVTDSIYWLIGEEEKIEWVRLVGTCLDLDPLRPIMPNS